MWQKLSSLKPQNKKQTQIIVIEWEYLDETLGFHSIFLSGTRFPIKYTIGAMILLGRQGLDLSIDLTWNIPTNLPKIIHACLPMDSRKSISFIELAEKISTDDIPILSNHLRSIIGTNSKNIESDKQGKSTGIKEILTYMKVNFSLSDKQILEMTIQEILDFIELKNNQDVGFLKNITSFLAPVILAPCSKNPNSVNDHLRKIQNINNSTDDIEYNDKELDELEKKFKGI
ncbi:hypothetical protein LCGC14_0405100 [marine sediment metagenome]|uniref:Uncharacterized protein n=1 Tax=marine sediment metagenome TaxID=412755 RepID=A0A0F9VHG4_9ZZZZ